MVPSWEICWAPSGPYGLTTVVSGTSCWMRAKSSSMARRTSGSFTPWGARKTTWPWTPVRSAKPLVWRISKASWLSEPGRSNSMW